MIVALGSRLWFEMIHKDCKAVVAGPHSSREREYGPRDRLPTDERGFYTLSIIDRQNRNLKVTLIGENANPSKISDSQKGRVVLGYRVEV